MILKKNDRKFTQSFKDEAYWSNLGCNSIPFNLLLPKAANDTYFCSFDFISESTHDHHLANRKSLPESAC
jgi:hypothetical protein